MKFKINNVVTEESFMDCSFHTLSDRHGRKLLNISNNNGSTTVFEIEHFHVYPQFNGIHVVGLDLLTRKFVQLWAKPTEI